MLAQFPQLYWGNFVMIAVGLLLLYLAIVKEYEPVLLLPIGFGCLLANLGMAATSDGENFISVIYRAGIETELFPLLIFVGVGGMIDFSPLLSQPRMVLLGAAGQFGIYGTLILATLLGFTLPEAASIGVIGAIDGPTAIFVTRKLAPHLLAPIAVAAYSYMALVPLIQPPIMRALTNPEERRIRMTQLRYVGRVEKIVFPIVVLGLCMLLLPSASPLIGFFMFGNLMRECGVVERLSKTTQNALINTVTIFLGLGVGSRLSADNFLNLETLGILLLGVFAFSIGTASGVIMAKVMNRFSNDPINPLIGSAGVSAVPMAARVSQKLGIEADPENMLLMFAMGPNVAGVIGSAVAAGVLLTLKNLMV